MNSSVQNILVDYSTKPFSYNGTADCCAFVCDIVKALTGRNLMESFRYNNEAEAEAAIKQYGTLKDLVTAIVGPSVPLKGYATGDIVVVQLSTGEWIVGVVLFDRIAVRTKKSLTDWPIEYATCRWRV